MKIDKQIYKKIVSLQDYKKTTANKKIVRASYKNNNLLLIGIKHHKEISKSLTKFLIKQYNDFKMNNKNLILVIEGCEWSSTLKHEEIINLYKESGYVAINAAKNKIKILTVEPQFTDVLKLALKLKLTKKDVAAWFFISTLIYQNGDTNKHVIDEKLKSSLNNCSLRITKNELLDHIKKLANSTGRVAISYNHKEEKYIFKFMNLKKIINPNIKFSTLNNLAAELNKIRDYYIANNLLRLLKKNNVIAIYGLNHVDCIKKVYK